MGIMQFLYVEIDIEIENKILYNLVNYCKHII